MKSKINLMIAILLLIPFSSLTYASTGQVITITDQEVIGTDFDIEEINGEREIPEVTPHASGTFDDPIPINFTSSAGAAVANVTGTLSQTSPSLDFYMILNASSFIEIKLSIPALGDGFVFFLDVFNEFDFLGSIAEPVIFPQFLNFPIEAAGRVNLVANGFNPTSYYGLDAGDSITFNLEIKVLPAGTAPGGAKGAVFQSLGYKQMNDILRNFENQGYLNSSETSFNLGSFAIEDDGYAMGVASSIFGLMRAGEIFSTADAKGEDLGQGGFTKFIPYYQTSLALFDTINSTNSFLTTHGLVYWRSDSGSEFTLYLEDQLAMMWAMLELIYYTTAMDGLIPPQDLPDIFVMEAVLDSVIGAVDTLFPNTGEYREFVVVDNDFNAAENSDAGFIELDTLGLMIEVYYRYLEKTGDGSKETIIDNVFTFIETNMMFTPSDVGVDILGSGLGAEFYTFGGSKSDTASLRGNALLMSGYTPSVGPFVGWVNITRASELASNTLSVFSSSKTGLLYNVVNVTDISSTKISSTFNVQMFITALGRLTETWKTQFGEVDDAELIPISRTWLIRSFELTKSLNAYLLDTEINSYFGKYDEISGKLIVDDEDLEANLFIANAFSLTSLSSEFPIEMEIQAQDNVIVGEIGQIVLQIHKIVGLINSYAWFQPEKTFTVDVVATIPEFGFSAKATINLNDFFNPEAPGGGEGIIPFFFEPLVRGSFDINVAVSLEGLELLSGEIELTALGSVHADFDFSELEFATDDDTFTASITLIDENGAAIPNLKLNASLGSPLGVISNYTGDGRSDSSGKVEIEFDIEDFEDDKVDVNFIGNLPVTPEFLIFDLFLNVTNADDYDLKQEVGLIIVPVTVILSRSSIHVSPSTLESTLR